MQTPAFVPFKLEFSNLLHKQVVRKASQEVSEKSET